MPWLWENNLLVAVLTVGTNFIFYFALSIRRFIEWNVFWHFRGHLWQGYVWLVKERRRNAERRLVGEWLLYFLSLDLAIYLDICLGWLLWNFVSTSFRGFSDRWSSIDMLRWLDYFGLLCRHLFVCMGPWHLQFEFLLLVFFSFLVNCLLHIGQLSIHLLVLKL
jgi:hypothetical protein